MFWHLLLCGPEGITFLFSTIRLVTTTITDTTEYFTPSDVRTDGCPSAVPFWRTDIYTYADLRISSISCSCSRYDRTPRRAYSLGDDTRPYYLIHVAFCRLGHWNVFSVVFIRSSSTSAFVLRDHCLESQCPYYYSFSLVTDVSFATIGCHHFCHFCE